MSDKRNEGVATGGMAIAMAELARRCIGPDGTVVKVFAEGTPIVRAAFISRLAEAAMKILDEGTE
ncbi:hypothetical protein E5206_09555 [Arthrobacter sp. PAMC25564]|uniref:hypothetical protein n=1 Tax=Arthrobacter sp. PAMC25564 TaxID=2565366 RepID=UPI0010A2658E|nr:hypothetical protein [Arthrobacter sp. PAMC25564]QCB97148.1 hypothetical protein E5206_09555 [Arthrobacter sp. PAMC25564]